MREQETVACDVLLIVEVVQKGTSLCQVNMSITSKISNQ